MARRSYKSKSHHHKLALMMANSSQLCWRVGGLNIIIREPWRCMRKPCTHLSWLHEAISTQMETMILVPTLHQSINIPEGPVFLLHEVYFITTYCSGLPCWWVVTTGAALAKSASEDVQQWPVLPPCQIPRQRLDIKVAAGGTKGIGAVSYWGLLAKL